MLELFLLRRPLAPHLSACADRVGRENLAVVRCRAMQAAAALDDAVPPFHGFAERPLARWIDVGSGRFHAGVRRPHGPFTGPYRPGVRLLPQLRASQLYGEPRVDIAVGPLRPYPLRGGPHSDLGREPQHTPIDATSLSDKYA